MGKELATLLVGGALAWSGGSAIAHHSFAMFDAENPLTIEGTVQGFKFTSPHTFIILQVKAQDDNTVLWNLEGQSPSALVRDGWSSKSIKSGDELKMKISPLRSGAPGGAWTVQDTKFKDGRLIEVSH